MTFRLENGLTVVLEENHTAPVVAFQAWVKIGSADEPTAVAGIAHVFEHMLFKGTKRRGVGAIAQEVEGAGGEINAWTSYDETVYHLVLASGYFDTGLDILADTLMHSSFDRVELERERKVVLEEIKQGLDDPDRMAAQGLFRAAFDQHPYGRPVIGSAASVEKMSRADLMRFFERHYVAANVTLSVVGDFDSRRARAAIERAFAKMPAGKPIGPRKRQPEQRGLRVQAGARDVKEARVLLGFRVPEVVHADIPALDLLAVALGQGDSSRLNLEVVRRRQLVTTASAYVFSARDPGLLVVSANLSPGRLDEATGALLQETLRLAHEELRREEIAKARTILESDRVYDKETVQGYARKLGFFASIAGDVHFEEKYMARLQALSPGELRTIGARYLRPEALTIYAQVPEAKPARQPARAAATALRLRGLVTKAQARAAKPRSAAARSPLPPSATATPAVRHVFPFGLKLLVQRDPSVPIVAVRATWLGGLRYETEATNGVSNLIASLLSRGTRSRTAEQIMLGVEEMAGSLSGYSGRNSLGLQAEFLARHWERGLTLVADCLVDATFSDEELEKERRLVLEDIRAQEDSLSHVAFQLFHGAIWKKHPYRLDPLGTLDSVSAITRRRLVAHFRRHYGIDNLTMAIVGDVDPDEVVARVGVLLAGGARSVAGPPATATEHFGKEPVEVVKHLIKEQAHVVLGFPGTTLDSPERFPLELLSQVLSGQGGRLFVEIREKRALAYRVSAFSLEGIDPGYFAVYFATSPEKVDEALGAVRAQLADLVAHGVSAAELERAKRYLVGTHAIGLQRKSAIAAAMAFHEAYGQGFQAYREYTDRIERVTAADLAQVARRRLGGRAEILAIVRPPALSSLAASSPSRRRAAGAAALKAARAATR